MTRDPMPAVPVARLEKLRRRYKRRANERAKWAEHYRTSGSAYEIASAHEKELAGLWSSVEADLRALIDEFAPKEGKTK